MPTTLNIVSASCLVAVVVTISIYDEVKVGTAGVSGETWLYLGQTLTIRCKLTWNICEVCNGTTGVDSGTDMDPIITRGNSIIGQCSTADIDSTIRRDLFNFSLDDNSHMNRRLVKNKIKVVANNCQKHFVIRVSNITKATEGMYECVHPAVDYSVDLKVVDRVTKPKNISCTFVGKRSLNCTFRFTDNMGYNRYGCRVKNWMKKKHKGGCSDNVDDQVGRTIRTYREAQQETSFGVCTFNCIHSTDCKENFMLSIKGWNYKQNRTFCHFVKTRLIIQPGPVGNLTVINSTISSLTLQWTKPDDLDNDVDTYIYTVQCVTGNEDTRTRTVTSASTHTSTTLKNLKAGHPYTCKVVPKPERKGFTGQSSTATGKTRETVPVSGPLLPAGSFSVYHDNLTYLGIYWQKVPGNQQRGIITRYKIRIGNDTITKNATHHWTVLPLPVEKLITVTLNAATRKGYSKNQTTLNLSRVILKYQTVSFVNFSTENNTLMWKHTSRDPHIVRAYRCYGSQNIHPQLVDCKTEIEYRDMYDTKQNHVQWKNPPAPSLSCEKCQWNYAVSVLFNNGTTAGMLWNTGSQSMFETSPDDTILYVAILPLVSLLFICVCVLFTILVRKKLTCKTYVIILPSDGGIIPEGECDDLIEKIHQIPTDPPQRLRDSGNKSIEKDTDGFLNPTTKQMCVLQFPVSYVAIQHALPSGNKVQVEAKINVFPGSVEDEEVESGPKSYGCTGEASGDESDGSGVSDYRLQITCGAEDMSETQSIGEVTSETKYFREDMSETQCNWDENEHTFRKESEQSMVTMGGNNVYQTFKKTSRSRSHSTLSSYPLSSFALHQKATSYSKLSSSILVEESSPVSISKAKIPNEVYQKQESRYHSANDNLRKDFLPKYTADSNRYCYIPQVVLFTKK